MRRPELELKIRNIISFHYGLQLWSDRPELEELESTEDFITSLTDLILGPRPRKSPSKRVKVRSSADIIRSFKTTSLSS